MFEDCLVESRTGSVSASKRWTTFTSITLQCGIAALFVALPMFHPETLPFQVDAPHVLIPLPPKPPTLIEVRRVTNSQVSQNINTAVAHPISLKGPVFPGHGGSTDDTPPTPLQAWRGMGSAVPAGLGVGDGEGKVVSVAPARSTGPLHVSLGVLQGMLLAPILPTYPAIARAAGIQGTVVVEAIISRAGTIEQLRVVSGPMILQAAAMDAIRVARYKPFLLNGTPTEVQTTITVNFRMGA